VLELEFLSPQGVYHFTY